MSVVLFMSLLRSKCSDRCDWRQHSHNTHNNTQARCKTSKTKCTVIIIVRRGGRWVVGRRGIPLQREVGAPLRGGEEAWVDPHPSIAVNRVHNRPPSHFHILYISGPASCVSTARALVDLPNHCRSISDPTRVEIPYVSHHAKRALHFSSLRN